MCCLQVALIARYPFHLAMESTDAERGFITEKARRDLGKSFFGTSLFSSLPMQLDFPVFLSRYYSDIFWAP